MDCNFKCKKYTDGLGVSEGLGVRDGGVVAVSSGVAVTAVEQAEARGRRVLTAINPFLTFFLLFLRDSASG